MFLHPLIDSYHIYSFFLKIILFLLYPFEGGCSTGTYCIITAVTTILATAYVSKHTTFSIFDGPFDLVFDEDDILYEKNNNIFFFSTLLLQL